MVDEQYLDGMLVDVDDADADDGFDEVEVDCGVDVVPVASDE